ncbi:MAG: hypothetical protein C3F12_10765 [Candidatus Methylomirabilota bacterium]|nr:hypothetical protein [Candidatus Methylomirabilis sp.]PWB44487.1 MAG: hypothetical protein C3F12_10765 [candidate division NC10 bacterium]
MVIEEIMRHLPTLAAVMGEAWLRSRRGWAETFIVLRLPWYEQLEKDLAILEAHVGLQKLIACYRASLHDMRQVQKTIYEVHGAALLANGATQVGLHVPLHPGTKSNFDVWAEVRGHPVNAESKTRKDEFPFKLPSESEDSIGITSYMGSRATLDPHDAVDLGLNFKPATADPPDMDTPESTVIRQLLLDGLSQLPDEGCNVIIFGHIEGHRIDFEEALWGTELVRYRSGQETRKPTRIRIRAPTGAFCPGEAGVPFQSLSGVLWVSMCRDGDVLERAYKLYVNPNARPPLPGDVIEALDYGMRQWATPPRIGASPE